MKESLSIAPTLPGTRPVWARALLPSLSDVLAGAFLVWLFAAGEGWKALLGDGDTGWHIRTGDWILQHGRVPQADIFSFSRPDQAWYAWEWLTDVTFSWLHTHWGLTGVVLLVGVVISSVVAVLFQNMMWRGANLLIALVATLLAMGSASVHYLARPHIFTVLLMAVSLWILERDRRAPGREVWVLVPMAAIWSNLHGGFLALLVTLGLLTAATAIETWLASAPRDFSSTRRYGLLGAAAAMATLANPYGYQLHVHILRYMRSSWILDVVEEFQSPRFRNENIFQYGVLLFLGLGLCGLLLARKKIFEVLLIVFWAQASLTSVRHVPIFALAAAPIVAEELTGYWNRWAESASRASIQGILRDMGQEFGRLPMRTSVWFAAMIVAAAAVTSDRFPTDFPDIKFPVKLLDRFGAELAPAGGPVPRTLTSDQWGDYLTYRYYPRMRIFIDGRSDFFGPELGKEYLHLAGGHYDWKQIVERYRFDYVLVPVDWPLATLFKSQPGWRIKADDGLGILFEPVKKVLMSPSKTAERLGQQ